MSWEGGKGVCGCVCVCVYRGGGVVRWQGGKGGRILRWHVGRGGRVVRRQGGKGWRVSRWQGFLCYSRVSQRFHLFVSDVNQWNKSNRMGSRCSCVVAGMKKLPLDLTQVVKNMVGCGSVWNL